MNKSFNKLIKSNLLLAVLSVFTIILLVSSVSYSLFIKEDKNSINQSISIGDLSARASSSTFTLSGMYPETESSALAKSNNIYTFTLTNDGDYFVNYDVYLTAVSSSSITSSYYQYIMFKLDNGTTKSLNDVYSSSRFNIISGEVLKTNTTENHTIRFWLSDDAPNDVIDKQIVFNLVFNATADKKYSTITFDAGDGVASETTQIKYVGFPYGDMPTAYRNGYMLDGWYTNTNYTTKVTEETVDSSVNDRTLYAKYTALGTGEELLATKLVVDVYGKTDSYLYHHINDANGYGEQSIDAWTSQNANDGGYRYSGPDASVNNFICFGTTDLTTCKTDTSNNGSSKYLYRIIGVFGDNVKIIMANPLYNTKADPKTSSYSGEFRWDYNGSSYSNIWSTSSLKQWLNGETLKSGASSYYPDTTFMSLYDSGNSTTWSDKVVTYNWVVGGNNSIEIKVKEFYDYEDSGKCYNTSTSTANTGVCNPVSGKVGLMRVSDYGYAASPSYWNTTNLNSYTNITSSNWLYRSTNSSFEWTISPCSPNALFMWDLSSYGFVGSTYAYLGYAVRPSMYLNSTTQYISGDGSSDNPYIIE